MSDSLLEGLTELTEDVIFKVIVYRSKMIQIKTQPKGETQGAEYRKFPKAKIQIVSYQ